MLDLQSDWLQKKTQVSIEFCIDLEDTLAQIIPPELKSEIDDGRDGR